MFNLSALKLNQSTIKRAAISLVVAVILIGGGWFVIDWLSYKSVTFNLSSNTKSIAVYDEDQYETYAKSEGSSSAANDGKLESTGTLRLRTGTYYVVPMGDDISLDKIKIQINDNTKSIDIKPYYSDDYLTSNFSDQMAAINTTISDKYADIISDYTIDNGTFYHYGDWYGTTLYSEVTREGGSDTYGIILHNVDGVWRIAAAPELVFRYSDHKDIPTDIIDAVNRSAND